MFWRFGTVDYHLKLLRKATALFVSHLSVLLWMSDGVERGGECEVAGRAGVGLHENREAFSSSFLV